MKNILKFRGKSGTFYTFQVYNWPHPFGERQGAVYLFVKLLHHDFHVPVYLGITEDIRTLFGYYCKTKVIHKNDPTHICISLEEDELKREFAEKDLSELAQTRSNAKVF
jgi:hypothetical protein